MSSGGATSSVKAPAALNPEQLALTQPWKDFVSRGLITAITAVFTPGGTSVNIEVSNNVPVPEGTDRLKLPPGLAKQIINDSGLIQKKGKSDGKKKEQPLPTKSLCDEDGKDAMNMEARIKSVSDAIGATAAAGRIGSLKLFKASAVDFESWWKVSNDSEKVRLLTTEKYFKAMSPESITSLGAKLATMNAPFRGSVPTPAEEEGEPSKGKKEKASTKQAPASLPNKGVSPGAAKQQAKK